MDCVNTSATRISNKLMIRQRFASTAAEVQPPLSLMILIIIIIIGVAGFSLLQLILPLASASGPVPFFQLGPDPNSTSLQPNVNNSISSSSGGGDFSNATLKTYEN